VLWLLGDAVAAAGCCCFFFRGDGRDGFGGGAFGVEEEQSLHNSN
jgi:hypothetical protein